MSGSEEYRPWCLGRREPVKPGDPYCADPNCDAHRERDAELRTVRMVPVDEAEDDW